MSNQPAVIGPDGVARPYIGGQALLEGVMMRSPHAFSAVVRRRDGSLVVRERPMVDLRKGHAVDPGRTAEAAAAYETIQAEQAAARTEAPERRDRGR